MPTSEETWCTQTQKSTDIDKLTFTLSLYDVVHHLVQLALALASSELRHHVLFVL